MTADQFRSVRRRSPFIRFTIKTASGDSYPVSHPEAYWQSPEGTTVIVQAEGAQVAMIDVDHITEVVYPRKPSGNGSTKGTP